MGTKDVLLAGLNALNVTPTPFDLNNVLFSDPVAVTGVGYNTRVTLTGIPGGPFKNSADFRYTRLDLASLAAPGVPLQISQMDPFTTDSLLAAITPTEVGRPSLDSSDVLPVQFPVGMVAGQIYQVQIFAQPTSLGWVGNLILNLAVGVPADMDAFHSLINNTLPSVFS